MRFASRLAANSTPLPYNRVGYFLQSFALFTHVRTGDRPARRLDRGRRIERDDGLGPGDSTKLPGFVMMGNPTVLIAGLPVPATVEIAKFLKNKLKGLAKMAGQAGGKLKALLGGGKGCK